MNRHPLADGWKVALSLFAGPIGMALLAVGIFGSFMYCAGSRNAKHDAILAAKIDTVRITNTVYLAAKADAQRAALGVAAAVSTLNKTKGQVVSVDIGTITLHVTPSAPPTTIVVPIVVTDLIHQQAAVIDSLTNENRLLNRAIDAADSTIKARDNLIQALKPSRCGRKCGAVLDIAGSFLLYRALK